MKQKNVMDLVQELQEENDKLQGLYKLFNSACKLEFGMDIKAIHNTLEKVQKSEQDRTKRGSIGLTEQSESKSDVKGQPPLLH